MLNSILVMLEAESGADIRENRPSTDHVPGLQMIRPEDTWVSMRSQHKHINWVLSRSFTTTHRPSNKYGPASKTTTEPPHTGSEPAASLWGSRSPEPGPYRCNCSNRLTVPTLLFLLWWTTGNKLSATRGFTAPAAANTELPLTHRQRPMKEI